MSTENNETSHLNEDFSQGEDLNNLDQQELETVTGGTDLNVLDVYLEHSVKLNRSRLTGFVQDPVLRRTKSAARPEPEGPVLRRTQSLPGKVGLGPYLKP